MAMIQVCDKCGKEFNEEKFDPLAALYITHGSKREFLKVDLCRDCQNELYDWNNIKKAKVVKY